MWGADKDLGLGLPTWIMKSQIEKQMEDEADTRESF